MLLSLHAACDKDDSVPVTPTGSGGRDTSRATVYPRTERFSGLMHVNRSAHYGPPDVDFDTIYQQVIEVIHTDSFRVRVVIPYWNTTIFETPNRIVRDSAIISATRNSANRYVVESNSQDNKLQFMLSGDSVYFEHTRAHKPDEATSVNYSGRMR